MFGKSAKFCPLGPCASAGRARVDARRDPAMHHSPQTPAEPEHGPTEAAPAGLQVGEAAPVAARGTEGEALERILGLLAEERKARARARRWWVAGGIAAAVLLVAANAALAGYLLAHLRGAAGGAGKALPSPGPAGTGGPVYEPPSRDEALTTDRIHVGRSDDTNDVVVTVDAVEFRRTGTRLWLTVENRRAEPVQFMAGATATLIDDKGNVYRADPFQGDHPFWTSIPPGGKESGWMVFGAVPRGTKSLRLVIPDVFTLRTAPWTVEVEFPL